MNKFKLNCLLIFSFVAFQTIYAQTENERKNITKDYDIEKLKNMSLEFSREYMLEKQKAIQYALKNNIDIIIKKNDGGVSVLQKILENGTPIYYTTFNAGSAVTINTNEVYEGGANILSLSGDGIILGIWDGGIVRESHQELMGRVVQIDNPSGLSSHATHVSGTMIASGVNPNAKGMSFGAELLAYDFGNDTSEIATEASNGMLVSNHSYGLSPNSIPEIWFGAYLGSASVIDAITYSAEYYLPVFAAGNSSGALPPHNPSRNGFDLISGSNLAKNVLCVANVQQVNDYVDASSVNLWGSSSWGPTDDGRIKPDISAKGRLTFSSTALSDDSYSSFTGTSMAAPAVSGSIGLLHEHHNNIYNGFLTAASMRALVIHTAREAGDDPGPDYKFGWGLMDTSAAADLITNTGFTNILEENTLNDGDTYSITVDAVDPNTPLLATLTWTDPAGPIQNLTQIDDPTPRLVNDLDLKIIAPDGATEQLPWTLSAMTPDAPAIKANNNVDNVEKVEVDNALGQYTIEVSHKGNLQDLLQNYTLVVSGIVQNEFALTTDEAFKSFCANEVATFNIDINSIVSFSDTVTISQAGLPSSFGVSFSNTSITGEGSSLLTIDNLASQPTGDYPFTVTASTATETLDFQFSLNTREVLPLSDIIILSPASGSTELLALSPTLEWELNPDAISYEVEVSTTSNFDNIIFNEITEFNEILLTELNENQTYHFRVRSINDCITGNYTTNSFTTKPIRCEPIFMSTDTPVIIDDVSPNIVQAEVSIPGLFSTNEIEDINITLDITHTWVSDLIITLSSPNGTTVTLLNGACSSSDDISVVFDDKGSAQTCGNSTPTLSGVVIPSERLSEFIGETPNGDWTLIVSDVFGQDGGTIDNFGIEICFEETLSVNSNELTAFSLYPNPTNGSVEINFGQPNIGKAEIELFDLNGRILKNYKVSSNTIRKSLDLNDLQKGIYLVKVSTQNSSITKKLILK